MRHDAVIFDLFGTLVHTVTPDAYHLLLVELATLLGPPADAFENEWRDTLHEREAGSLGDVSEILRKTCARTGREASDTAIAKAAEHWLETARGWLRTRDAAKPTIQSFRDAGYRVGLLSNCSAEVPTLWAHSPLSPLIDAPVFSCDVGMMKPDPRLYHHVCGLLDVTPEQCLFVGDGGSRELTGAAQVGMEAVLIRVPGEEHTWFDNAYRLDALEWRGAAVSDIADLTRFL